MRYDALLLKTISSFSDLWSLYIIISVGNLAVFGFVLNFWKEFRVKLEIILNGL